MARPVEALTKEITNALARYIDDYMSFKEIIEGWPEPNQQLRYPALSITCQNPTFNPLPPYLWVTGPETNNQAECKYVVGNFDWTIQLDIWCKTKEERHDAWEKLFNILHSQIELGGLSIKLEKYHNVMAHYVFSGYDFEDSEISSQRKEWRSMVRMLCSSVAISTKKLYIITEEPEIDLEIEDNPLL